jgi:hypothetical protein
MEERHQASEEAIAYYTKWLMLFTAILALATMGLGAATVIQLRLARAEFVSTHRPIIRVRRVFLSAFAARFGADNISHGDKVEIEIVVSNVGSNTAHITDSRYRIYFFKTPTPRDDSIYGEFPRKIVDEKMTLEAGESRRLFVTGQAIMEAPPPGQRIIRQFISEGWHMHVIGQITYQDELERKRQTGFLREWQPGGAFRRLDDPEYEYED